MRRSRNSSMQQFWLTYKNRPGSLIMRILVILSAVITTGILFSLIIYILIRTEYFYKIVCFFCTIRSIKSCRYFPFTPTLCGD